MFGKKFVMFMFLTNLPQFSTLSFNFLNTNNSCHICLYVDMFICVFMCTLCCQFSLTEVLASFHFLHGTGFGVSRPAQQRYSNLFQIFIFLYHFIIFLFYFLFYFFYIYIYFFLILKLSFSCCYVIQSIFRQYYYAIKCNI